VVLNENQTATIAKKLRVLYEARLEEVRSELEKSENQQYAELIGRVPADSGDAAVGDMLADLNLGMIDRHVEQLRDIEAARKRLAGGVLGVCVDCGGTIAFGRLLVFPTAKRCLPCQQKHESRTLQSRPSL
jgi:DnaK suppressor protein